MRGQSASLIWLVFVAPAVPVWTKDDVPSGSDRRMLHIETGRRITPVTADLAVRADAERTGQLPAHGNTMCLLVARLEGQ